MNVHWLLSVLLVILYTEVKGQRRPNLSPRERDYVIGLGWNHFFRCYDNQALRFLWFINGMEYQNNTPNIVIKNVTDGSNLELSKAGKDLDNTTITCQAFYRNGDNGISDEKVLFVQGKPAPVKNVEAMFQSTCRNDNELLLTWDPSSAKMISNIGDEALSYEVIVLNSASKKINGEEGINETSFNANLPNSSVIDVNCEDFTVIVTTKNIIGNSSLSISKGTHDNGNFSLTSIRSEVVKTENHFIFQFLSLPGLCNFSFFLADIYNNENYGLAAENLNISSMCGNSSIISISTWNTSIEQNRHFIGKFCLRNSGSSSSVTRNISTFDIQNCTIHSAEQDDSLKNITIEYLENTSVKGAFLLVTPKEDTIMQRPQYLIFQRPENSARYSNHNECISLPNNIAAVYDIEGDKMLLKGEIFPAIILSVQIKNETTPCPIKPDTGDESMKCKVRNSGYSVTVSCPCKHNVNNGYLITMIKDSNPKRALLANFTNDCSSQSHVTISASRGGKYYLAAFYIDMDFGISSGPFYQRDIEINTDSNRGLVIAVVVAVSVIFIITTIIIIVVLKVVRHQSQCGYIFKKKSETTNKSLQLSANVTTKNVNI